MSIHWGGRGPGHVSRWPQSTGIVAALNLNFLTSTSLDSRITFSRGTNATLVDATGKITYAPNNLLTYSEQFDNAAWTKAAITVSANATAAPDGATTADKMAEDATTAQHYMGFSASYVAAQVYVISVYAKAAEKTTLCINLGTGAFGVGTAGTANFNLSTGVVTSVTGTGASAGIASLGNGWYRCYIVQTAAATSINTSYFSISGLGSYAGTAGSGIYLWGAQTEAVTYQTTPSAYVATTSAAYYGPRFDYDPVTLAPKGLLVEEARTNLLTYTQQFDNAAWVKNAATVTADSTAAPDGTMTADTLMATAGTGVVPRVADTSSPTTTTSAAYTASLYVKAGTYTFFQIYINNQSAEWANFTLSGAGTATANGSSTASITALSNGWYRVSMSYTAGGTDRRPFFMIAAGASATRGQAWNPAGTETVYIWGAQVEAGSFATSYIPTVASQVTRTADVATMTGANFSSWYNQNEGTFAYEYQRLPGLAGGLGGRIFASGVGGSNSYGIWVNTATGTQDALTIRDISGDAVASALFSVNTSAVNKGSVAYKVNDFAWSSNGAAATTDTSGVVPSLSDQLRFGRAINTDGSYVNGYIRSISYYNTRLANATLQALTV